MPRRMTIWLAAGLLLAGCGGEPAAAPRPASPSPDPVTPTVSTPTPLPSAEPRVRRGDRRADDVDGDGRADLVVEARTRDDLPFRTVIHGSPRGLDPRRQTDATSRTFCFILFDQANWAADFDGDGHGDLLGSARVGDSGDRGRPCVVWGPRGLTAARAPTRVTVPAQSDVQADKAVAGDFDGDGTADMAMPSEPAGGFEDTDLVVLYGPFSRDGKPARQTLQPSPSGDEFWRLAAERIDGRRGTGLIAYESDDGGQISGSLFSAGPDGLAAAGPRLNQGLSSAFGDFDGDGTGDVAVGDSGGRNNEPGYETESPAVHRSMTVYFGDGRSRTYQGTAGTMVAGDFDGDARDDIAFGGGEEDGPHEPVLVFHGGPDGLRPGEPLGGVGAARPRSAGDFDGDGDDELVLGHGTDRVQITVTDGRRVLSRFAIPPG